MPPAPDWFDRRPLVVLALFTVAFYWKITLTDNQFTHFETPDLAYQVLPWYQMQARAMQAGVFPLWDPYQWAGQSLLGQMQPGAAFPLNWPLFLAPLRGGYIQLGWVHRHFVLMHLLAAFFMYWWCRDTGAGRFASVAAGAAFSFSGYVGTTSWPQMLHGAMWIPLVFLFFRRAVERQEGARWSNAVWCGGAAGLALLSGHHQAPLYILAALGGVWTYYLWTRPGDRLRLAGVLAAAAAVALLVGAFQVLPAWEYGTRAYRWIEMPQPVRVQDTVPYFAQYNLGIFPLSFLGVLFPKAHLTTDPFLGFVMLSFGLFAVAAGWDRRQVRLFAVVAVVAAAYTAGHYSLVHGLAYALAPFLDKARSPGHAIFVFQFAALTLSAQGIDLWFGGREGEKWRNRLLKGLAATGLLAWALLFWLYLNLKFETDPGDRVILSSIVAWLLAAVLYGVYRGHLSTGAARWSVALLALFEMSTTSHFFFIHRDDPKRAVHLKKLREPAGLMSFLKAQRRPFRFETTSREDFPPNLGDWEGVESTSGYLASVSDRLYDFVGWDWGKASLVLNTVYSIGKEPSRPTQREVFADGTGWKVFRNEDALPRVWVVHQARAVAEARQAAEVFRSSTFDPRHETILIGETPPEMQPCPAGSTAGLSWHGMHRLRAWIQSSCAGLAVFAEPHFPGWEARLDGRPARLYAPFGALRGVAVPAGAHEVELVYRPWRVYAGAALSALGILMCAGLAAARARRASS
jgi:hypothetical protein